MSNSLANLNISSYISQVYLIGIIYLLGLSAAIYLTGLTHRCISQTYLIGISHMYISQVYPIGVTHRCISQVYVQQYISQGYLQRYISQVYLIGVSHRYNISHRCICSDICHRNHKISTFFMLLYWVISTVYIFQQNQLCLFLTVKSVMLIPYS